MSGYQQIAVRHDNVDQVGSVAVVKITRAEFKDELHIRDLGEELVGLLDANPPAIVLNFGDVVFLSSSGFAQLIKLGKRTKAADVRLVLTEINEVLLDGLRVTHLDKQFEIISTEKRALASLAFPPQ